MIFQWALCHEKGPRSLMINAVFPAGRLCETEILECASDPCLNGAQCEEQINGYMCNCTKGEVVFSRPWPLLRPLFERSKIKMGGFGKKRGFVFEKRGGSVQEKKGGRGSAK